MMNQNEKGGTTLGEAVPAAVVVEVPSTAVTPPQQPHVVYVVQQHPPAVPPVRVNSGMQCCYPVSQLCLQTRQC